ncbi:MAG TPA: hypothetical protein VGT79_02230 [Xanthomonadaceae bacterium]|nr:hypothetical protein [Xanthomonadaceae bacterium]
MQQQIPDLVAERVFAARRQTYASNAEAWKRRALREGSSPELPPHQHEAGLSLEEMGGSGLTTKPLVLDKELRFWAIDDDEELDDFLTYDLLGALFGELSEEQWRRLPRGYRPLVTMLEFERHQQFEGWTAVENRCDDMLEIIESYRFLGLDDEANALEAVRKAYAALDTEDPERLSDVLSEAYHSVPNSQSEEEVRMTAVYAFVRAHPELFREA